MASKFKRKRAWMVMSLEYSRPVSTGLGVVELPMTWADGMIGVMPVFRTKKAAMGYAGCKWDVMALEYDEKIPEKGRAGK